MPKLRTDVLIRWDLLPNSFVWGVKLTEFFRLLVCAFAVIAFSSQSYAKDFDIVGKWGDSQGRIGCYKDNEFLTFDGEGGVTIPEGARFRYARSGNDLRLEVGKGQVLILKVLSSDKMDLVGFEEDGKLNRDALETWQKRHRQFIRCKK